MPMIFKVIKKQLITLLDEVINNLICRYMSKNMPLNKKMNLKFIMIHGIIT
jgi:hypothetical protein